MNPIIVILAILGVGAFILIFLSGLYIFSFRIMKDMHPDWSDDQIIEELNKIDLSSDYRPLF